MRRIRTCGLQAESHEIAYRVLVAGGLGAGVSAIHESLGGIRLDSAGARIAIVEAILDNRRDRSLDRAEHGDVTGNLQRTVAQADETAVGVGRLGVVGGSAGNQARRAQMPPEITRLVGRRNRCRIADPATLDAAVAVDVVSPVDATSQVPSIVPDPLPFTSVKDE